jgi:hypothetical protein
MRRSLLKFGGLVIVAICLGGHISELFDRWESTVISGNDVDYVCVVVAAVVGAVIVVSKIFVKLLSTRPAVMPAVLECQISVALVRPDAFSSAHSPPLALRI